MNAQELQRLVMSEAARQGVDPALVMPLVKTESAWNPEAISRKQAVGLMQILPSTAAGLGVKNAFDLLDPAVNARVGVQYFKQQLDRFGSPELAYAAYNAGPGAVAKHGGVPPYAETQDYVRKNMGKKAESNPFDRFDAADGGSNPFDRFDAEQATAKPKAAPAAGKRNPQTGVVDMLLDSPVGGFLRGARDVVDGGAQLLTRGLEAVAPAGSDFERFIQGERRKVEAINTEAERDYRQNWRRGEDTGLDVGRIAGNIAASLPVAGPIPGMAAKTLLPRVGASAVAGAVGGGLQPVDMTGRQDGDFWSGKGEQVAIGGLLGTAAPVAVAALAKAGGKVVNKFAGSAARLGPAPSEATITQTVTGELSSRGIDFARLSKEVQDDLLAQARKGLAGGGKMDFDALARKADFEALGIKPTTGQLTRDPMQFQFEQNTRGIAGAGEDLMQRFNEQNAQLIDVLNKSRSGAQGVGLDRFGAGDRVLSALRGLDASRKAGVDQLYTAAREQAGIHSQLDPARFANGVNDALDQAMLGDALPGGIRTALNQIATGKLPFTIQKAEQIRQAINGQMGGIPGRENAAMRIVNNALQDEIDRVGSAAGQQAGEAFKAARAAAAERFSALDKSAPLKAAVDGAAPDDFMQKYVISGKARDLMALRADLQGTSSQSSSRALVPYSQEVAQQSAEKAQLWNEVRGQVVDWLKERALNGATDEFGRFSQSAYNKALNQIGNAKLKVMFSPEEVAQLKQLGRVASAIQAQPVGSVVNNSGTSQAVANLLARASNVPYLKEMVINPARNFILQGKVNAALNPSVARMTQPSNAAADQTAQLIRRLQLPFAVGGYPTAKGLLE